MTGYNAASDGKRYAALPECQVNPESGGVAEWFKALVLKTSEGESLP